MPPSGWAFLDDPGPLAIAHRGGGNGVFPENSLQAFDAAVALGYRHVETDVHATRDGVLVAFHDDELDALTDMRGPIGSMDWAEVSRARIAGRAPIPRLDDILATWPDLRVNIDPKTDAAAALLPDIIRRHRAISRVCIGSFSDRRIARLRQALGPELCTSMGPRAVWRLFGASLGLPIGVGDAGCVQIPEYWHGILLASRRLVDRAHAHGLQVHVWTVNAAHEMTRLLDRGVDGLITDELAILRDVLRARGAWHQQVSQNSVGHPGNA